MALKESYAKKLLCGIAILFVAILAFLYHDSCVTDASAETATANPTVVTEEVLIVALQNINASAIGDTDQFIRNWVDVAVATNNAAGYVAYMYKKGTTSSLANTAGGTPLATLSGTTTWNRSSSVTNFWGYSLDDGNETGTYHEMRLSTNPVLISSSSTPQAIVTNVWFGAKIDGTMPATTYFGTVVFTVISGMNTIPSGGNPDTDPAGPQDTSQDNPVVAYDSSGDQTVYTDAAEKGTRYTEISTGDNRSHYPDATEVTFTPPQGVTTYIGDGTPLATGLAVTSAVAAVSGVIFLIATKRDDDDEEEENN